MNNFKVISGKSSSLNFNSTHISFCVHTGFSMNPILQNFDILEIEPYKNRQICTGDIICFQIPDKSEIPVKIIHRIIKINSKGIYTRGDNSKNIDPWILSSHNIHARVTGLSRSGRHITIAGGKNGIRAGFTARQYCAVTRIFSKFLSASYHYLAETDIFTRLLPAHMRPCIITYQKKHVHIMIGKTMAGRYDDTLKRWIIKKPFRLFVNEKSLPCFHDKF